MAEYRWSQRSALVSALLCFFIMAGVSQVRIPRLVSDGMVLQRGIPLRIWGWAGAGQEITVSFQGEKAKTVTNDNGRWAVQMSPKKAGGPYNMDIDGINHIELRNVLVGDVWLCSGQSNMELTMERVKEKYPDVIAQSKNDLIRQFKVPLTVDFNEPHENVASGHWEAANPTTVLAFSAVAYFFAREVFEHYHVPVGLITNAVGGAPAEAWLSADALVDFPYQEAVAARFANKAYRDSIAAHDLAAETQWYEKVGAEDKGLHDQKPWYDPSYDASGWAPITVPGYWADQGGPKGNSVVWYRKEIDVPAEMAEKPAKLLLGVISDRDSVFLNGVLVGTIGYQYPPRRYELAAGALKTGKNILVVRIISSTGRGGFVPDKPYRLTAGDQSIDLRGQWTYQVGAMALGPLAPKTFFQYLPTGLFNGMLAPVLDYTVKGVLWYQGEANTARAMEYRRLFPAMINDWRRNRRQTGLPFVFVQLPNYGAVKDQPDESKWAELREAQRLSLAVPGTGMAVTMDLGEWNDLHPLNKEDVAKRLFLAAERVAYGRLNIISSGPLYRSIRIHGKKIAIRFTEVNSGLIAKGGGELRGFAVAGPDDHFVWAKAEISGKKVIVWSDQVPHPVAVRYAWADNPQGANLYNRDQLFKDGLPASPFEGRRVPK